MRTCLIGLTMLFSSATLAEVQVSDASVRLLPPGVPNTSAYFTISNTDNTAHQIIGAQSDVAGRVELHAHMQHNGMMHMMKQDSIELKAGEQLQFSPGGYHLMLFDLKQPLKLDEKVNFTLLLQDGSTVNFTATVVSPMAAHQHH